MFQKLLQWLKDKHVTFAIFFTIYGSVLEWFHRLDLNYIALITAVQGFLFAHSAKDDYFANKNGGNGGNNVTEVSNESTNVGK